MNQNIIRKIGCTKTEYVFSFPQIEKSFVELLGKITKYYSVKDILLQYWEPIY